jgi:hypothetical protein
VESQVNQWQSADLPLKYIPGQEVNGECRVQSAEVQSGPSGRLADWQIGRLADWQDDRTGTMAQCTMRGGMWLVKVVCISRYSIPLAQLPTSYSIAYSSTYVRKDLA